MSDTTDKNAVTERPALAESGGGKLPWSDRKIWFWVLTALLITVLTTIVWAVPVIESRLDRISRSNLLDEGVDATSLNLRWNYRNLSVKGEIPHYVDEEQLTTALRQGMNGGTGLFAKGIRRLQIDVSPAPVEEDLPVTQPDEPQLAVEVRIENNTATLDGVVQTDNQRQVLLNALLESGTENISDNLDVMQSNTASNGGDAKIDSLANLLMESGPDNVASVVASLDEDQLNYRINARDSAAATAIEEATDIAMVDFQVTGDTYTEGGQATVVDVLAKRTDNELTLTGQVFSEEQRRRIVFAANEAAAGNTQVNDQLQVIQQQALLIGSDARVAEMSTVLSLMTSDVSGELNMRGDKISLQAQVDSPEVKEGLLQATASVRSNGLTVNENIVMAAPEPVDDVVALQQSLNRLSQAVSETVVFNSGNATLSPGATATLDQVARVINSIPAPHIEVEGHTDNQGRDSVNEALSRKRALAVKEYLVSQSVDQSRLVAVGYGERNPVASNKTREGRKKNRRVHFNVVKPQQIK